MRNWRKASALAVVAGALSAMSITPAFAYVDTCTQADVVWTPVQQITLQPETTPDGIWASPVSIQVNCKDSSGALQPLHGASFTVEGYSYKLTDLHVTVNGSDPTSASQSPNPLPVAQIDPTTNFPTNQPLVLSSGLISDTNGTVSFNMRAYSASQPELSPNGDSTEIGLQFEVGTATPTGGGFLPVLMLGGGQIFAATPELDSVMLFGSGALGMLGYAMTRRRAARRRRD